MQRVKQIKISNKEHQSSKEGEQTTPELKLLMPPPPLLKP